ncbi:hypothetical protein BDF14DRAFT_1727578 [Spinellus fusiger]|nr:hypothetical protein BDF14DRAFT_1727578 [Spinellus fusiger]
MLPKLFLLATLTLSAVNAQSITAPPKPIPTAAVSSGVFSFKETYPSAGSKPNPKPEWISLISNATIANAPVLTGNSNVGNSDAFCDWSFTGCTRPTDIVSCPKGQWGITYDDGPTDFSSKLYDFLDTTQQKATLFMIGGQVVRYPNLVKRAYDSGHEIAIHTWSHSYLTTETNEQIIAELKWTELAIEEVTGRKPRFFRPPYGDIDDRVRDIGKALGFTPVIWNHDTDDWMLGESTTFQASWIDNNATQWVGEAATATVGGVSLEHDLYAATVDAAIRILPLLQKAYKVTTIGSCSGQPSYKDGGNTTLTTSTASTLSSATQTASSTVISASIRPAGPAVTLVQKPQNSNSAGNSIFPTAVTVLALTVLTIGSLI